MSAHTLAWAGFVDEPSEARTISEGLRRRDVALLHRLVECYQYRLMRYLLYLTGRRELAEDLFQETWLRVLERGAQFDGRSRFEPWLFSIARNLVMDYFRKKRMVSLDSAIGESANLNSTAGGQEPSLAATLRDENSPSPFELAARGEDAARLAQALVLLAPIYREVLVLRFQEQLSLQEVARVTGAPVPTVSSRLRRGLEALRLHLEASPLSGENHVR
jgi:RNA polymerase sigma-70 factor (ECF subfamily)